jgi:transcriptional regulator with XRE-family HTH domain
MIYFIGNNELVKIGFTEDIENRLQSIADNCPFSVKLLGIVEGDKSKEQNFHQIFKEEHSHKEWFFNRGKVALYLYNLGNNELAVRYRKKYFGFLKEVRTGSGFSLMGMAEMLNVKAPTVDAIERNFDTGGIKLKTLIKYLGVLGYEIKISKKTGGSLNGSCRQEASEAENTGGEYQSNLKVS